MDFQNSVEFIAGVLIVVAAGIALGMLIRRPKVTLPVDQEQIELYGEIVTIIDGLRDASESHKGQFIDVYYRLLLHGSDRVIKAANAYLQASTASDEAFSATAVSAARDQLVYLMRQDIQSAYGWQTNVVAQDLYSVEINRAAQTEKMIPPTVQNNTPIKPSFVPEPRPASEQQTLS